MRSELLFFYFLVLSVIPICHTKHFDFDYFVFAQQWPATVCVASNLTHEHKCRISQSVSTWTVHGIWPTKNSTEGPCYCNNSSKFNLDKIKSIEGRLEQYWPNLYTDTHPYSFWEREWMKHGTCAAGLPSLNTELKYFTLGINLNRKYDLLRKLSDKQITPKDYSSYQYDEVLFALNQTFGHIPKISCIYDKARKVQYILQLEICLNKELDVIECVKSRSGYPLEKMNVLRRQDSVVTMFQYGSEPGVQPEPCRDTDPISYPEIHHV